jgi:IgA Peptidase M64/PEP-CTERM motif
MQIASSITRMATGCVVNNARSMLRGTIPRSRGLFGRSHLSSVLAIGLLLAAAHIARAAFDTVVETGPSSNRVDVFFLGDGYTSSDISTGIYSTHVQNYVNYIFTNSANSDPYFRYQNFFNIYRVNVVSNESGADVPQNGIVKDTALDATYRYNGVTDRLLYIDEAKANTALSNAVSGSGKTAEVQFVTVNESVYGGGGGTWAVYAGGNSNAFEIALHESGHSFNSLADEYDSGGPTVYSGSEPSQVNVTTNSAGAKWSHWLGYNDPTGSVVGAYEGAKYSKMGIYRPTDDSKMRTLGVPFNAISREKIILDIYDLVDPLDAYTSNASTLVDPLSLSAMPVDTNVIDTEWFIDGLHDATFDGLDTLDVASLGLSIGDHAISLRAFDPTGFDPVDGWVRIDTDKLEQFVNWDVLMTVPEPSASALAALALIGFAIWTRRRNRRSLRRGRCVA